LLETIANWLEMQNDKEQRSQWYNHAFPRGDCLTFAIREKRTLWTVWNHSTKTGMKEILIQEWVSSSNRF
jgi:hypothetical protein